MEQLFLEDLKDMSEEEVKNHLVEEYEAKKEDVDKFDILIAYESVGWWGCDSSSFFLLKDKETGELYENHGSHCSCYGFEGQFSPELTTMEYLKSQHCYFDTGGYDNDSDKNLQMAKEFIQTL